MPQVIMIGVGGPTCSGKTTLAKHLRDILPRSFILHQDDFGTPEELLKIHPIHHVVDFESPETAILWDKQRATLRHIRSHGCLPEDHRSQDSLNPNVSVPISNSLRTMWRSTFEELVRRHAADGGDEMAFVICEGFLMLWDEESLKHLDVRFFVREQTAVLKQRRAERTYYTSDEAAWKDPPGYWDNFTWPAFLSAHRQLFIDGDVEAGLASPDGIQDLVILESKLGIDFMVNRACEVILDKLKAGRKT